MGYGREAWTIHAGMIGKPQTGCNDGIRLRLRSSSTAPVSKYVIDPLPFPIGAIQQAVSTDKENESGNSIHWKYQQGETHQGVSWRVVTSYCLTGKNARPSPLGGERQCAEPNDGKFKLGSVKVYLGRSVNLTRASPIIPIAGDRV